MKIIISLMDGKTEMYSISRIDRLDFNIDIIIIKLFNDDIVKYDYSDIRSIVIA